MKRYLSFFLCLAMVLSMAPAAAFAEDGDNTATEYGTPYGAVVSETREENTGTSPDSTEAAPDDAGDGDIEGSTTEPESLEEETTEDLTASASWVNPLYESAGFSACEDVEQTENVPMLFSFARFAATYYTTIDDAAAYVRGQMVSHNTSFSVYYTVSDTAYLNGNKSARESYLLNQSTGLYKNIMNTAMEHTGKPREGDSLLYIIPGYSVTASYSTAIGNGNVKLDYTIQATIDPTPNNPSSGDEYTHSGYYTDANQEAELTRKVNEIITELNLTGQSDFEKVRAVYKYIVDHTTYDMANLNDNSYLLKYTAYAAAVNSTAVCQGIAALFYRLMLELGVDTRVIGSVTANHAWNIVELNDKYYDLDATWDIKGAYSSWRYFLRCPANFDSSHPLDANGQYVTTAFTTAYPMSTTDYIGTTTVNFNLAGITLSSTDGAMYIDGTPYTLSNGSVTLPDVTSKSAVMYAFNSTTATDVHTVYPTNMYAWILKYANGAYTATRLSAFDNIMQYAGSSIRLTGNKGIRMITSIPTALKTALTGAGSNGYTLEEYGTLVAWSSALGSSPLVKGGTGVGGNYAYSKAAGVDPIYKTTDTLTQFTNVLTFTDNSKCVPDLAMRPYMILKDANGVYVTLYGGIIYRNIGYIAYQNRNVFSAGTDAYNYINGIYNYVYPNGYPA